MSHDTQVKQEAPQMDWQQVVLNGGPPCFFVEGPQYCGRAERWQGHGNKAFHDFVSLDDRLATVRREEREAEFTAMALELRKFGPNIRRVDLLARFQELFRELEASASEKGEMNG